MEELPGYVEKLSNEVGAEIVINSNNDGGITVRTGATYPFPGAEKLGAIKIAPNKDFQAYSFLKGMRGGARLFRVVELNVEKRGIKVLLNTPAQRLISDGEGRITGVKAETSGREINIKVNKGVILASGGFENADDLKVQFSEIQPIYPIYGLGNTGDGIKMAQKAGASLWHMWHFHGSYGFKFPEFPMAFRTFLGGPRKDNQKVPWIIVDKRGGRFMNEYPAAVQDTPIRAMQHYAPETQDFPRIPCYLIFDDNGRKMGPIAFPMTESDYNYEWSKDNGKEIDKGWIKKADSISELAKLIGLDDEVLPETVQQWNNFVDNRKDPYFKRPYTTMMPVENPPYYAIEAWPVVNNTQGDLSIIINNKFWILSVNLYRDFIPQENSDPSMGIFTWKEAT